MILGNMRDMGIQVLGNIGQQFGDKPQGNYFDTHCNTSFNPYWKSLKHTMTRLPKVIEVTGANYCGDKIVFLN